MQAQRWSVKALAAELGIERPTLSSYLTGRRKITGDIYVSLVKTLKVHPAVFLGPEDYESAIIEMAAAFGLDTNGMEALGRPRFPELEGSSA